MARASGNMIQQGFEKRHESFESMTKPLLPGMEETEEEQGKLWNDVV